MNVTHAYAVIIVNLVLVEFLVMAVVSFFWNGLATRGTGKFFGPFALLAGLIVLSIDVQQAGWDVPTWLTYLIWTAFALVGMRTVVHMIGQVVLLKQTKRAVTQIEKENGNESLRS